jgi:LPS sulfotransferase NodH
MNNLLEILQRGEVRRTVSRAIKESPYLRYLRLIQLHTRLWGRPPGTLPSVLVIGAQRSGSTFLHDMLARRTTLRASPLQKEVHYFDNKFYRPTDWYARFFEEVSEHEATAKTFEASPSYLYHPAAPRRVRKSLPSVKLIAVLRNPVERAISQYKWIRQVGLETRGAAEAFRYDAERLDWEEDPDYLERFDDPLYFDFDHIHRGYLRRSLYDVQLRRWLEHFDSERIRVVASPVLFNRTEAVLTELAEFLGVTLASAQNETDGTVNQNASRDDVLVPQEARQIARRHLADVPERTEAELTDQMVIGERPLLEGAG